MPSPVNAITSFQQEALPWMMGNPGITRIPVTFSWPKRAVEDLRVLYFDGLRSDSRYADLSRRAGLPV